MSALDQLDRSARTLVREALLTPGGRNVLRQALGLGPDATKAYKTSPKNLPPGAQIVYNGRDRIGKPSAPLYRNWADHGEWVRAAVNVRKTQLSSAEWDIVPYDTEAAPGDVGVQRRIRELFEQPNDMVESFRSWVEPIAEDTLVLDAGCIEKERTLGGEIYGLHGVDGGKVFVSTVWDGDPDEYRYYWMPVPTMSVPFKNTDMVYIMANPRTYTVVGLSALETLRRVIDAELSGSEYNVRQVQNAAPDGILDLGEGARPEQVEAFKSYWLAEVAGRGALAFIGGTKNAKFVPFRSTNRDMQFLEWQIYLVRKICAVMGLSPQDLGITFDINRATGDVQQELTEDRGLRPFLALHQDFFTREIVWDKSFGGRANNWAFRFVRLNIKESTQKASINKLALAGMPWLSINTARMDEGRQPIGDPNDESNPYNKLMANTPLGLVTLEDIPTAKEITQPPDTGSQSDGATAPKTPASSGGKATKE